MLCSIHSSILTKFLVNNSIIRFNYGITDMETQPSNGLYEFLVLKCIKWLSYICS